MIISYTVDRAGRIFEIEGPWDAFASANGAAELTRQSVLGMLLFDYVAGPEVEELLGLLLERARKGQVVRIPFRCDSPSARRFLRLEMRGKPDGAVVCESILEREEVRPPQPLLDPAVARSEELIVVCSWCKKLEISKGAWAEVEEVVEALQLFHLPKLPRLSHGICERCIAAVFPS